MFFLEIHIVNEKSVDSDHTPRSAGVGSGYKPFATVAVMGHKA